MFILKSVEKVELRENFLVVNGKELNFGELTEDDKEVLNTMISKGSKYLPLLYLNSRYVLESIDGKKLNKIEYLSYLLECKKFKKVGVRESDTHIRPLTNVENLEILEGDNSIYFGKEGRLYKETLTEGRLWGEYEDAEDIEREKKIAKEMQEYADNLVKAFKDAGWTYDDSSAKYGHYKFSKDGVNAEYCDNFDKMGSADIESEVLKDLTEDERERYDFEPYNVGDDYAFIDFRWRHPSPEKVVRFVEYAMSKSLKEAANPDRAAIDDPALNAEEEEELNSLYDREIENYTCPNCGKKIPNILDWNKKYYKDYGTEYYCPYCGEPYTYKEVEKMATFKEDVENEEAEDITYLFDRWDWEIAPTTSEELGMDYSYFKLVTNIEEAEKFNYHSDYWGSADDYQNDAVEVMADFEPYVGKRVKLSYDDGTSETFIIKGLLIDKQYNSLSHLRILVEDRKADTLKESAAPRPYEYIKKETSKFERKLDEAFNKLDYESFIGFCSDLSNILDTYRFGKNKLREGAFDLTDNEDIKEVSPEELNAFLEAWENGDRESLDGQKLICFNGNEIIAIDNSDGYARIETFDKKDEGYARGWLNGKVDYEDFKLLKKRVNESVEDNFRDMVMELHGYVEADPKRISSDLKDAIKNNKLDDYLKNKAAMTDEEIEDFKERYLKESINEGEGTQVGDIAPEEDYVEPMVKVNTKKRKKKKIIKEDAANINDIEYVEPNYTGGGIYVYTGKLKDGNYFLGSDDWFDKNNKMFTIRVVNENPDDYEEDCWFDDWQQEHLVRDLTEEENKEITKQILHWIIENKPDGNYDIRNMEDMLDIVEPERLEEAVEKTLADRPIKDLTGEEFLKMLEEKYPNGFYVETNAGCAEYRPGEGLVDTSTLGDEDAVYPFKTMGDLIDYFLLDAEETFGEESFNDILSYDGEFGMPHFRSLDNLNEAELPQGGEEACVYIFNKYRDEYDSINDVRDIQDYLNKLYDEGGMEKVDTFFLPSTSRSYKNDYKRLLSKSIIDKEAKMKEEKEKNKKHRKAFTIADIVNRLNEYLNKDNIGAYPPSGQGDNTIKVRKIDERFGLRFYVQMTYEEIPEDSFAISFNNVLSKKFTDKVQPIIDLNRGTYTRRLGSESVFPEDFVFYIYKYDDVDKLAEVMKQILEGPAENIKESDIPELPKSLAKYLKTEKGMEKFPTVEKEGTKWFSVSQEDYDALNKYVSSIDSIPENTWRSWDEDKKMSLSTIAGNADRVCRNCIIKESDLKVGDKVSFYANGYKSNGRFSNKRDIKMNTEVTKVLPDGAISAKDPQGVKGFDYISPSEITEVNGELNPKLEYFAKVYYAHDSGDHSHKWTKKEIKDWVKDEIEMGNDMFDLDSDTLNMLYQFQHELYQEDKEEGLI